MGTPVVKPFRSGKIRLLAPKGVESPERRERSGEPDGVGEPPKTSKVLEDDTPPGQAGTREDVPSPAQTAEGVLKRPDLEHGDRRAKEADDEKSDDGGPEAQDQSAEACRRRAEAAEIDKGYEQKLERLDHSLQALRQEDPEQSTPSHLDGMALERATDPPLMRRFHFHLRARGMIHRDIDGTELPDVAAARAHAVAVADKLMRHCGAPARQWSMWVEDDAGQSQFDLSFVDVKAAIAPYSPDVLFRGAYSPTAVTETCRRLGEPIDPEQSTTLLGESVALAAATQNLTPRPSDGTRLERFIYSSDFVPPERGINRLGAILPIGLACAVVAPIAYYVAVGNPFSSGSNRSPPRPELQHAMEAASVWEPGPGGSQSGSARRKTLANAKPPNAISEKQAGQPSHPMPTAFEDPAGPQTLALATAPATAPVEPQSALPRAMEVRPGGMDPDEIQLLLKQGQEFVAVGDLATARIVLRRAAEAGDVAAAFALAQCYDPKVLTQMRVRGVEPEIGEARRWYQIARHLGSTEAARHLELLPPE